jgi:hypothetical protein
MKKSKIDEALKKSKEEEEKHIPTADEIAEEEKEFEREVSSLNKMLKGKKK